MPGHTHEFISNNRGKYIFNTHTHTNQQQINRKKKDQNDQAKIFYMNLNVKLIKETKETHINK